MRLIKQVREEYGQRRDALDNAGLANHKMDPSYIQYLRQQTMRMVEKALASNVNRTAILHRVMLVFRILCDVYVHKDLALSQVHWICILSILVVFAFDGEKVKEAIAGQPACDSLEFEVFDVTLTFCCALANTSFLDFKHASIQHKLTSIECQDLQALQKTLMFAKIDNYCVMQVLAEATCIDILHVMIRQLIEKHSLAAVSELCMHTVECMLFNAELDVYDPLVIAMVVIDVVAKSLSLTVLKAFNEDETWELKVMLYDRSVEEYISLQHLASQALYAINKHASENLL